MSAGNRPAFGWVGLSCLITAVGLISGAHRALVASVQSNPANWGLQRIDQPQLPLDSRFRYDADGTGVDVYVIDNGVLLTNRDFAGRGQSPADMTVGSFYGSTTDNPVSSDVNPCPASDGYDGHGTHNASYAIGATYGVAKKARLHVLKVSSANCQGGPDINASIHAFNWITRRVTQHGQRPGVINHSFWAYQGARDPGAAQLQGAILGAISAGFVVTLSAGCRMDGPAGWGLVATQQTSGVLIVAGTNARDGTGVGGPGPEDYGSLLTLFAPGIGVTGAGSSSDADASAQPADGTCGDSFATAHVAGVAAVYRQQHPGATPAQVRAAILGHAAVVSSLPKPMLQMTRDELGDVDREVRTDLPVYRLSFKSP
jgi:subtilisin family serine protease